jgi:hypothetical protein
MFGLFKKDKFKIGDNVICIDDRGWNESGNNDTNIKLTYKKIYKIQDINKCKCGHIQFDIGGRTKSNTHTGCGCKTQIPGKGIHWAGAFRFRKPTEQEELEFNSNEQENIKEEIESLVSKEQYELAAIKQKELKKIK